MAFAIVSYLAYKQFKACWLCPGKLANIYLAELQKLSVLFDRLTELGLNCASVTRLSEHMEQYLGISFWIDKMDISQFLA